MSTNQSDRELLELAAKAAGIELGHYAECIDDFYSPWNGADAFELRDGGYWNPLTDDGDALRLAVKLRLSLNFHTSSVMIAYLDGYEERGFGMDSEEATRRAIVRAAAEIGRAVE